MSPYQHVQLGDLELRSLVAHGGHGKIEFARVLSAAQFHGPWKFVDYVVVPPGASIGVHTHGENEELYLVLEGQATMTLEDRELQVRAGDVIVNPPFGTHGLLNDSDAVVRLFVIEVALS